MTVVEDVSANGSDACTIIYVTPGTPWAVRFYEKHGFRLVGEEEKNRLLAEYWSIPERQVETSVVLVEE